MNNYRQVLYHIVFCTHKRQNTILPTHQDQLYRYIWGIVKSKDSVLYRINGTENHVHILSDLHPTIALSNYIRDIKRASSLWMKRTGHYPHFTSWADGACVMTYSFRDKEMITNYIKNQKEHHKKVSFEDEYLSLLKEHGISYEDAYVF
jgi:Transposase and inactivated derivatives